MSKLNPRFRRPAFVAVLLAATAMSGLAGWQIAPAFAQVNPGQALNAPAVAGPTVATAPIDTGRAAAQALPGFADLVQRVSPAVVTISTTMRQQASDETSPFPHGSPQERMFGKFFGAPDGGEGGDAGHDRQPMQVVHALGSGFIVDAQGHIVTNNHVVKDATDIQVTLADGRTLKAHVVGVDPKTDLAVLQVKSDKPLPHLALGDSNAARVGDWVVAVGNPFGLGGTVTAGILSARGRQIGQGPYDDFLQIDAPINRGNSGGPLFAQDGSVIGVNTAIFSPSGGSVGIGFAIPSSVVKQVVGQLESNGKVSRGWLGVSAQTLTPTLASALQLSTPDGSAPHGALVSEVQNSSPAAAAGLKSGDVITRIGTTTVQDPRDLARIVAAIPSGTEQDFLVHRDGQDRTVKVTVAALPGDDTAATANASAENGPKLGLALAPLDDRARQALSLPDGQRGVVIASVLPNSPADNAGLQAGDVLEMVGSQVVNTPQDAVKALHAGTRKAGDAVALRVVRDGHQAFVALGTAKPNEG